MRYFGKDGGQCALPDLDAPNPVVKCRKLARAVLFGRIPRSAVVWLGMGVLGLSLVLWLWSVACVSDGGRGICRDVSAALSIRR
ncbi:MAG: hypothetical protein V1797_16530 [Pseudomonadota bacterium]